MLIAASIYLLTVTMPVSGLLMLAARRERQRLASEREALQRTLLIARRGRARLY